MYGKHRRRVSALTAALLVASVGMLGFGGSAGAKPASGETLKFGYLDVFTGVQGSVPSFAQAIKAYLDDWNDRGGYHGQPVQLITEDVGFDPARSIAAANRLIDQEDVVAFLNPGFCTSTINVLRSKHVPSWGDGTNPDSPFYCFDDSIMVSPAASSNATVPMLQYAIDHGVKTFGMLAPAPIMKNFLDQLRPYLEVNPGTKLVGAETPGFVATAADVDVAIAELKDAGVEALFSASEAPGAVLQLTQARLQNFGPKDGIMWFFGPNIYDPSVADVPEFAGTYVLTLTYPWEDTGNPQVKRMTKVIGDAVDLRDGFAESGYQSGALLEKSLKGLKGEVTRESLLKHWQSLTKIKLPLTPLTIDFSNGLKAPAGGQILKVEDGKFVPTGDYLVVPAKEFHPK
jgi:branched-chain amino acid transport system substrate-binding protein